MGEAYGPSIADVTCAVMSENWATFMVRTTDDVLIAVTYQGDEAWDIPPIAAGSEAMPPRRYLIRACIQHLLIHVNMHGDCVS